MYFFQTDDGFVKVGKSRHPAMRLSDLQVANHRKLTMIDAFVGDHTLERWVHRQLLAVHVHGEWFRSGPEVDLVLATLRNGAYDSIRGARGRHE